MTSAQIDAVDPDVQTLLPNPLQVLRVDHLGICGLGNGLDTNDVDVVVGQDLTQLLHVVHDGHIHILDRAVLEELQIFVLYRGLDDCLLDHMGVILQQFMGLGKDGPGTVDVEQLAVGEILHHFCKTLDVLSAGLVDAVVELQCVDLCGGHGLDVLLRFQQARLLRIVEGIDHAIGGFGQVALEHIRTHLQCQFKGGHGALDDVAAPCAAMHRNENLFGIQTRIQQLVDLLIFFFADHIKYLISELLDHSLLLSTLLPRP